MTASVAQPRLDPRAGTSEEARTSVAAILEPSERIEHLALAVGCTLVLTDRRVVLVRDALRRRPTTGIRSFRLDRETVLRMGPDHRTVVLRYRGASASAFVRPEQLGQVVALVAGARRRVYRA
jgi:hypothetical protein